MNIYKFFLAWACIICILLGTAHILTFLGPLLYPKMNSSSNSENTDDPMAILQSLFGQQSGGSGLSSFIVGNELIQAILFFVAALILFIIARLLKE